MQQTYQPMSKYMHIWTNKIEIQQRCEKLWTLLARGMKRYEVAKELTVDPTTVSRDIAYLVAQPQDYLNSLTKEILPFMYQTSIEGIRDIIKESLNIYQSEDKSINMYQKLARKTMGQYSIPSN